MEPILFAGHPQGSSLGLVAAFEWVGKPYRVTRVAMPEDMLTETFARVNGRRETPVLVLEDGGVLTETTAIARWLELHDDQRRASYPPDSAEAHRVNQFIGFLNSSFTGAFSPLWVALEIEGVSDEFRQTLREYGRSGVALRHAQLEAMMDDGPYLVRDKPTLADALFVGVARWAEFHNVADAAAYPKVQALKARLEHDPAVAFGHAIENGVAAGGSGAMIGLTPLAEALARARPWQ